MSYLVIARKFRPQTFSTIIGQEHISKALANAIVRDKVPHSFLFTGPRGVGKTTAARVLARALNCLVRGDLEEHAGADEETLRKLVEPCGECTNCLEIARSSSIAVWEIDGASNNGVENVRELIDSLRSLPPPGSRYKIYIIDEVHMLSGAAFNALLKSLEEPPPNTIFIFATTEPHKIPDTVVSRCQQHDFRRLPTEIIADHLSKVCSSEGLIVDPDVLKYIARRAQGGMRDAQSMLDRIATFSLGKIDLQTARQVFGAVDESFFFYLSRAVLREDVGECFSFVDQAFSQSLDLRAFLNSFVSHWRSLLIVGLLEGKSDASAGSLESLLEVTAEELSELRELASHGSSFDFRRLFEMAENIATAALQSNYPRYVLEAGLAKMASLPSMKPIKDLLNGMSPGVGGVVPAVPTVSENNPPVPRPPEEIHSAGDSRVSTFNPSWENFIQHVKSRSEHVLAAFLRRVSAERFAAGKLDIRASSFDVSSLKEAKTRDTILSCLHSYSGTENWTLSIEEAEDRARDLPIESIAVREDQARTSRRVEREREAREDPAVKVALSTFEGSEIEKVSVTK